MNAIIKHTSQCMVAGVVALLPIGGMVLAVVYAELLISESWLANQPYYFPGMGLLGAVVLLYLIGLVVTTFIGRWVWTRIDTLLAKLPALGNLYQTLKQILGYGEGEGALFERVVLVPSRHPDAMEMGLVTCEIEEQGKARLIVFIPGAPNPSTGRLIVTDPDRVKTVDMPVSDVLKALVSLGKTPMNAAVSTSG